MSKRNLIAGVPVGIAIFSAVVGCGSSNMSGNTSGGGTGATTTGGKTSSSSGGVTGSSTGGKTAASSGGATGSSTGGKTGSTSGGTTGSSTGGKTAASSGGVTGSSVGGVTGSSVGGVTGSAMGGASGGATATSTDENGGSNAGGSTGSSAQCIVPADANTRREAAYPAIDAGKAGCGSWALEDNVCCAQYCNTDNTSESCDKCGGAGSAQCTPVNSKACISGQWPEVHCVGDNEDWHYSRSTHFGLTSGGACQFGFYGLCTTSDKYTYTDPKLAADCDAFCKAYPDLCKDPADVSLRGNFAAPQGNYYTQFWPSLDGDRDNYLSCGECFELVRTKQDGTEYQPGETGYTPPVVLQVVDSCPCSANSKWCCGSGRDHCGEITSGSFDFKYGCPTPPGDLPPDHEPQVDESIHLDLSDIAMARLQSSDPNKGIVDGVIPTKYKRVPCPVVGNMYVRLIQGGDYYFALTVVNAANLGSIAKVEAQLASGGWATLVRDQNYTSSRPQERTGNWVTQQGQGPFALPVSLRITDPSGRSVVADGAIKAWPTAAQQDGVYIDTGVQF